MIQLQCLNKILQSKDLDFIIKNNLDDSFFTDYPKEFAYIKDHIKAFNTLPDFETFLEKFPDFDVIKVSEPNSYLLNELSKDKNKRLVITTFNNIRDLLVKDKVEDALTLYHNSIKNISNLTVTQPVDILHDISRYDTYIERSKDYTKHYVKTGFPELDEIIGGWDRDEELVTIVAKSGVGKSWIGLKTCVEAAKQGLKVGLYSGEMTAKTVGYRADSLLGHISNTALIRGNLDIQTKYKNYLEEISKEISGEILVLTPDMVGGKVTVSTLQAFIEKENLDMLCIDQRSHIQDERKAKSIIEQAANISVDLQNLQATKHIPIITISQQNRTSTDNGISTDNIAQSDQIGRDSTIVLFVEQKDGILTLNLVKSRFSQSHKKIQYAFDFDKGLFTYIPAEETSEDIVKPIEEYELASDNIDNGENVF